jgi:RND family efflux transporter MFP subunit
MMRRSLIVLPAMAILGVGAVLVTRAVAPCAQPLVLLAGLGLPLPAVCAATQVAEVRAPLPPAVSVTQARTHAFVERLFVSGTIVARDEAMVGAQIDGLRIVEFDAEDGDRVVAGQVLARLDRSQLDAQVAQSDAALARADAAIAQAHNQIGQFEANLAQTTADFDRATKLGAQIISGSTLDQREAAFRSAQSALAVGKSAEAVAEADKASRLAERRELMVKLDRTDVKAPVAGVVSRRAARVGAVAMGSSDALFRVVKDGALDLEAEIPEQSLARLAVGGPARIIIPGVEAPVEAHVRLISAEVDKASRLGKARFALPPDAPARIGSFASGEAIIATRDGVGAPTSALQRMEDGDFVQVVSDDRVTLRKVTTGITEGAQIEIRDGLRPGETLVARAAAFLRPGDRVRPVVRASVARDEIVR